MTGGDQGQGGNKSDIDPNSFMGRLQQWRNATKSERGEMPFLDHLEELRWRIFKAIIALIISTIVGFLLVYFFNATDILVRPIVPYLTGDDPRLQYLGPADPFFILIRLSFLTGLILAFPIVLYQVWAFLAPALEKRERRILIPSLYFGMLLFGAGVALAYYIALPISLEFFFGLMDDILRPGITASEYISFVTRLLVAFGIVFELPVVIMILSALGLVTPDFLRRKRRHALVIITVVASMLSPGDTIQVTALLMGPLVVLYEVSIVLSRMIYRRKKSAADAPSILPPDESVEVE